jgi:hypothetical protein
MLGELEVGLKRSVQQEVHTGPTIIRASRYARKQHLGLLGNSRPGLGSVVSATVSGHADRGPQGRSSEILLRSRPTRLFQDVCRLDLAAARDRQVWLYAKPPLGGPKPVLAYLSRFTHGVRCCATAQVAKII